MKLLLFYYIPTQRFIHTETGFTVEILGVMLILARLRCVFEFLVKVKSSSIWVNYLLLYMTGQKAVHPIFMYSAKISTKQYYISNWLFFILHHLFELGCTTKLFSIILNYVLVLSPRETSRTFYMAINILKNTLWIFYFSFTFKEMFSIKYCFFCNT